MGSKAKRLRRLIELIVDESVAGLHEVVDQAGAALIVFLGLVRRMGSLESELGFIWAEVISSSY